MIKNLVKQVLASQHSWRADAREFAHIVKKFGAKDVRLKGLRGGFDELSELYVSMFFRSLALSIIGIFVPVFLLKNGYGVQQIFMFFMFFFACRCLMDIAGGYLIARFGPKHTMVVSYVSQIIASLLFLSLPSIQWPLLLPAFFWATANSFFFIAFHVDFSKVKHSQHGGKELGFVHAMERIGGSIGPFIGGLLAYFLDSKYIFLGSVVLLLIGLFPLFKTSEPTRTKQHLDFKNFKAAHLKHDVFSYACLTMENNLSIVLWPLFLALFALGSNVFLELGALTSIGIAVSVAAAYYAGRLVDAGKGPFLFRLMVGLNTAIYALRPFVASVPAALGVGVANEAVTMGYRVPYQKSMYDAADDLPGYRIVYLVSMEAFSSFTKFNVWAVLYMLAGVLSSYSVIVAAFIFAGIVSLGMLTQKFKSLEYAKK